MDILTIGLTLATCSKFGNKFIGILALIASAIEMVAAFNLSQKTHFEEGVWGDFVGTICLVICIVKLFGKNGFFTL